MVVNRQLYNVWCKDYCKNTSAEYCVIEESKSQKIYIPNYTTEFESPPYEIFNFPEKYVAELSNVKIIGGNGIIFDDENNCIYDLALSENENRYNLAFNSAYYVDKSSTFVGYEENEDIIDEGIMLAGVASFNYYHFNIESLSKLCLINKINKYNNIPIIVDEAISRIPQLYEELSLINKGKRKIYFIKSRNCYKVNKLIYISDLAIIPLNISDSYKPEYKDLVLSDLSVNLIHDNLAMSNNPSRRIFISRKKSWNPRLRNTNDVEKIFESFGYESVYPEEMTFKAQLQLFSEAKYIAGPSGAGFTNILFANKNNTIICIVPQEYKVPCFSNVAGILGQKYFYQGASYGHSIDEQPNNTIFENQFDTDVNKLIELLEKIHN